MFHSDWPLLVAHCSARNGVLYGVSTGCGQDAALHKLLTAATTHLFNTDPISKSTWRYLDSSILYTSNQVRAMSSRSGSKEERLALRRQLSDNAEWLHPISTDLPQDPNSWLQTSEPERLKRIILAGEHR